MQRWSVADVMTTDVIFASADDDCQSAMRRMDSANIRHLPVVSDGHVVSMLSIRDLMRAQIVDAEAELEREAKPGGVAAGLTAGAQEVAARVREMASVGVGTVVLMPSATELDPARYLAFARDALLVLVRGPDMRGRLPHRVPTVVRRSARRGNRMAQRGS